MDQKYEEDHNFGMTKIHFYFKAKQVSTFPLGNFIKTKRILKESLRNKTSNGLKM